MKFIIYIVLGAMMVCIGCSSDDDGGTTISANFELPGTWYFDKVDFDGTLYGLSQSGTDNEPEGFVTFEEDGTGTADFKIDILGYEYSESVTMTWVRNDSSTVTLTKDNGEVVVWTILEAEERFVIAEWEKVISSLNKGTFKAELSR